MPSESKKIIDLKQKHVEHMAHRHRYRQKILNYCLMTFILLIIIILFQVEAHHETKIIISQKSQISDQSKAIITQTCSSQNLLWTNMPALARQIKSKNPLISNVKLKFIFGWGKSYLLVDIQEDFPWAIFSREKWLLTSSGRLVRLAASDQYPEYIITAVKANIIARQEDFDFWEAKARDLQKLILSVKQQAPELNLLCVNLADQNNIILIFDGLEIMLGRWDDKILSERASRIFKIISQINQTQKLSDILSIDLSNNQQAIIKQKSQ